MDAKPDRRLVPMPPADVFADHYGTCKAKVCKCLRDVWRGRECSNWVPISATDWEGLKAAVYGGQK